MGYFSNGTEGMIFEEQWCSRCVHSDDRPGKEIGDRDNPPCPVWMAHLMFAYDECDSKSNAKTILDMLITPREETASDGFGILTNECKMFHARDAGALISGQLHITT